MTQFIKPSAARRAAMDRKNARARAKRAALKAVAAPVIHHAPFTPPELMDPAPVALTAPPPVPCPFCDKLFPGVYGVPGVAMLRADNRTVICAECGTREALEGGLLMPVSRFLEFFTDSHNVYDSDSIAARLLALTGVKAPWTPRSAQSIRREMRADPRGGSLDPSVPDSARMVAGFVMAEALAWELARYHSTCTGRGFRFRECIDALRGNGK